MRLKKDFSYFVNVHCCFNRCIIITFERTSVHAFFSSLNNSAFKFFENGFGLTLNMDAKFFICKCMYL